MPQEAINNKIFIEQAPLAIAMFDKDMRYMAVSKKWITDYQLAQTPIIGKTHYEVFPEIGDEWKAIHQACLAGAINQCDEACFQRADGTEQWITWDVRPWYISEGNIGGILIYTADITANKLKDAEQNRTKEILDKTNEIARIGTWEVDLVNGKSNWSRVTKEIHQVPIDYEPDLDTAIHFYKEGDSRNAIQKAVNAAIEHGTTYDLELELVTAQKNNVWVRSIGQAEFKHGKCVRLYGVFQDITHIKQQDAEKRRIEHILAKSNQIARIATWEVNTITGKVIWNSVANEIFETPDGYQPDASSIASFYKKGKHYDALIRAVKASIEHGTSYDVEARIITAKGYHKWLRVIGEAEFVNGVCIRRFGIFQDITKSKEFATQLNQANEELKAIFNSGYVSIITTDTKGMITHFNAGARKFLQYTAAEMIGNCTPEIIHLPEEIAKRGKELSAMFGRNISGFDVFVELARHSQYEAREWTYVRKDGSQFPVQLVVSAIRNNDNSIIGFLGIATDISDIKKVEAQLLELNQSMENINRQLIQKNGELEQFAYVAAHDLQEPLRMISSFLSLLEKKYTEILDDTGKEYIRYSVDGANRMRAIIKDILNFSNAGIVNNIAIDLNGLVQAIIQSFKGNVQYEHANITLQTLPTIQADVTAMQQLFTNLIGNGLKYQTAGNTPVVEITVNDHKDKWLFKIADNGIGIHPENYDKVFALFKRLHSKSEYAGTGIGLATCKKIVSLYNGDIWIEPNANKGSIFCFTIRK